MTRIVRTVLAVVVVVVISVLIMQFSLSLGVVALVAGLAGTATARVYVDRAERGSRSLR